MKKYESPKVKFESIRLNEKIANTCWGHHSSSNELFYDVKGTGYIGFQIVGGSCNFTKDTITVKYYNISDDRKNDAYNEFYSAVINSGGSKGQPYKGEGTVIIPDDPGNMS